MLAPFILLAALRVLTLPGSLVPGSGVPHEPASRAAFLGTVAAALSLLAFFPPARDAHLLRAGGAPWNWLAVALLFLLDHGLRVARRAPGGRTLLAALLALLLLLFPAVSFRPGLTLAAVFLIPWLRRADRRAAWLTSLGAAGLAFEPSGAPLGLGVLLILVLASHPAQRRDALHAAILPGLWLLYRALAPAAGASPPVPGTPPVAVPLAIVALLSIPIALRRRARPFDPLPRVALALGALLALGLLDAAFRPSIASPGLLAPSVLLLGVLWVPDEAPLRAVEDPAR
ncbi:MAG TPA: hypothetical protein ENJ09_04885 [Planctomycetes bacterium]|nr:hypothetical protein [Planctomycetota bacterium]